MLYSEVSHIHPFFISVAHQTRFHFHHLVHCFLQLKDCATVTCVSGMYNFFEEVQLEVYEIQMQSLFFQNMSDSFPLFWFSLVVLVLLGGEVGRYKIQTLAFH